MLVMGHGEGGVAIVGTDFDQVLTRSSDSQVDHALENAHVDTAPVAKRTFIQAHVHTHQLNAPENPATPPLS